MQIVVVGMNHKSAPIEIRELVAFKPGRDGEFLETLTSDKRVSEAVVLSTCNRTEVYAVLDNGSGPEWLENRLFEFHGIEEAAPREHVRTRAGDDVIRHLFHVSCSLDSLVLGESQILSQVKAAYKLAREKKATGPVFNFLFQRSFKTAKKVYATTGIARNKVSISSVAVELARQKLGDLSDKAVLIIGSGKVGRLSADHFTDKGIRSIFVANRTPSKARELAERTGGTTVPLDEIDRVFSQVDIIVGCTSAQQHILHRRRVSEALKNRGKPLFILDLGIPRNVDPEVATLDDVFLYNIDELEEITVSHAAVRKECAIIASTLVREEAQKAINQLEAARRREAVSDLVAGFEAIREAEVSRSVAKMGGLSEKQEAELENLTKRIMKKILHQPLSRLKPPVPPEEREKNLKALRDLFS